MTAARKSRHRAKVELRTEYRGREVTGEEAEHLRLRAGFGVQAAVLLERAESDLGRDVDEGDAEWLRRIMRAVEARIVEAVWTAACEPMTGFSPNGPTRHGQDYIQEFREAYANAVAAGGKWEQPAMRPPVPSAKAIDAKWEPLMWLWPRSHGGCCERREQAFLIHAAAATKRGEVGANVSWARVVAAMPELTPLSVRTLQRRYEDGIRGIVAALVARGEG